MFEKLIDTLRAVGAPVAREISALTDALRTGGITVLSAQTGAGKSLITPALWADVIGGIADESRGREALARFGDPKLVVVCVPRRFLAINNAETVAELAGLALGQEVGYATGEGHSYTPGVTRLLFATYGSALAGGLMANAMHLVFDEVHEGAMDISVSRALVHRRMRQGERVHVLEMSATLNVRRQRDYWAGTGRSVLTFDVEGALHPCERREQAPDFSFMSSAGIPPTLEGAAAYEAVRLIVEEGRKGVLIFRPGIGHTTETASLVSMVARQCFGREDVVGAAIHGSLDHAERTRVLADLATGRVKVLVGTNVIESGVNLRGVDAAVSCGLGKLVVQHPSGSLWLDERPLPQWRLIQQMGRVRRFSPGVFVLLSTESWEQRVVETEPEIARLPLTDLITTCAEYGVRAHDLNFDVPVSAHEIEKAERKLQTLEIIDADFRLTAEGEFGKRAPVAAELDSALWEARKMGVLAGFLPVAALIETGGLKAVMARPLNVQLSEEARRSDWLAEMAAYSEVETRLRLLKAKDWGQIQSRLTEGEWLEFSCILIGTDPQGRRDPKRYLLDLLNVSQKKYWAVKETEGRLRRALARELSGQDKVTTPTDIRRCIIAGEVNNLVRRGYHDDEVRRFDGAKFAIGRSSIVSLRGDDEFAVGELRSVTSREGRVFTFFSNVTAVTFADLEAVCPYLLTKEERGGRTTWRIFGNEVKSS